VKENIISQEDIASEGFLGKGREGSRRKAG